MKYKNVILVIILWVVGLLSACTHNDGDIGPLFGQWKLISIEETAQKDTYDNLFISFQSTVVEFKKVTYPHSYDWTCGDYEHVDNYLTITIKEGTESVLDDFRLKRNDENEGRFSFNVITLTTKDMVLAIDGKVYTFIKYGN